MFNKDVKECSFCGDGFSLEKRKNLEVVLIKSSVLDDIRICNKCLEDGVKIVNNIEEKNNSNKNKSIINKNKITPKILKDNLDEYIIGQDKAKQDLSIALYNHYKRISISSKEKTDITPQKSNVMLVGKSGTGKTSMIKALAKQLDIPVVFEVATEYSNSGYIGKDADNMLKSILRESKGDLSKAQKGIIVIDEIDKLRRIGGKLQSGQKDVNGEGVQQSILKMVEGGIIELQPERNDPNGRIIKFDTSNILFIVAGAFESIEDIVSERLKKKNKQSSLGFDANIISKDNTNKYNELIVQIEQEDIQNFGIIPELLGRLPIVTALEELSIEALENILTQPKNAVIKQYQELFRMDGINLKIEDEAITEIAKLAKKKGTEARALRTVVESVLKEAMFKAPSESNIIVVHIDADLKTNYIRDIKQEEEV